jgi:spore maturation protein CgeB
MKERVKSALLNNAVGRAGYGKAQEAWFEWTYRRRRESYEEKTRSDPDAFRPEAAVRRALARISSRGYLPTKRRLGDVHTFAFLPSHWQHQNQIAAALETVGPCTRFDYESHGFTLASLRTSSGGHEDRRRQMLDLMLRTLAEAHDKRPVDWFFAYALGWDMTVGVLKRINELYGFPTVNISLDDKNWWDEIERGDSASGLRNVGPCFDLGWTSARAVVSWYWAEGGQAIFLPEGVNSEWFRPLPDVKQEIDVGFVGNCFGRRPEVIRTLRKANISVEVYGNNWPSGTLDDAAMLRFFNACAINLGLGDMHYSRWLTNLKGRDFEIPSVGRGLYLTTYNADLASCFSAGQEIQCYRGVDELVELIRHHLRNKDASLSIAHAGRERCLREHQWRHRFETILQALGALEA